MQTHRGVAAPLGRTLSGVTTTSLFHSILQWLRAGYPEGVPGPDRVPLLALLRATPLTEDQVKEVVRHLTTADAGALADGEITRDEIAEFISDVTHHDAGPENVRASRPSSRRRAGRWPASVTWTRSPTALPQRRGIDDEAVPHVAGDASARTPR